MYSFDDSGLPCVCVWNCDVFVEDALWGWTSGTETLLNLNLQSAVNNKYA